MNKSSVLIVENQLVDIDNNFNSRYIPQVRHAFGFFIRKLVF